MNMLQLEFQASRQGTTQTERVRDHLRARPGVWVSMPELARVISPTGIGAAVHSRVNDCRQKFNMVIEHRNRRVNGQIHSEYCYQGTYE